MVGTVLPPSATSRGSGVVSNACTSRTRIGINPACFAKPAAAKKPKRPASFRDVDPPAKRVRTVCGQGEPDAATVTKIKKRPCPGSRPSSSRPASFWDVDPPAKRVRTVCGQGEPDAATVTKIKKRPCPGSRPSSPRVATVDSASVIKNVSRASQNLIPESALPSKTSTTSMSELITKARLAKARLDPDVAAAAAAAAAEAERLRDIQRRRAEARRELEMMVATVEFNDPFIDPSDVLK